MKPDPKLAVVAIGGNATFSPHIRGTAEEQLVILSRSCEHLVRMVESGYRAVLTHGNGPVIEGGGGTVIITSLERALEALTGSAGTRILA